MQNLDHPTPKQKSEARTLLQQILKNEPNTIRAFVAHEALGHDEDNPLIMFANLMQCGCQSGLIGSLIYYTDTHAFFDRYYAEIEVIREDIEDNLGEPVTIKGDMKNFFAWLAFEETAFRIANEDLGLEL